MVWRSLYFHLVRPSVKSTPNQQTLKKSHNHKGYEICHIFLFISPQLHNPFLNKQFLEFLLVLEHRNVPTTCDLCGKSFQRGAVAFPYKDALDLISFLNLQLMLYSVFLQFGFPKCLMSPYQLIYFRHSVIVLCQGQDVQI